MESKNSVLPALLDPNFSSREILDFLSKEHELTLVIGRSFGDSPSDSKVVHLVQDYSEIAKVLEIVEGYSVSVLVPGCTDLSYEICSKASKAKSLPFPDPPKTVETLFNKLKFADLCLGLDLPIPRTYAEQEAIRGSLKGNLIVKPADSYSGNGISVTGASIFNLEGSIVEAKKQSRSSTVIIQEFIEGALFSASCFIQDGVVGPVFFVRELSNISPFSVDTSYVDFNFDVLVKSKIEEYADKIASKLKIKQGLLHIQFILRDRDVFLIEATRRMPGDLYGKLIELSTGFPYAENYARGFLGMPLRLPESLSRKVVRQTIFTASFALRSLTVSPQFRLAEFCFADLNQVKKDSRDLSTRLGIAFLDYLGESTSIEDELQEIMPITVYGNY